MTARSEAADSTMADTVDAGCASAAPAGRTKPAKQTTAYRTSRPRDIRSKPAVIRTSRLRVVQPARILPHFRHRFIPPRPTGRRLHDTRTPSKSAGAARGCRPTLARTRRANAASRGAPRRRPRRLVRSAPPGLRLTSPCAPPSFPTDRASNQALWAVVVRQSAMCRASTAASLAPVSSTSITSTAPPPPPPAPRRGRRRGCRPSSSSPRGTRTRRSTRDPQCGSSAARRSTAG